MNRLRIDHISVSPESDWTPFPGGELEGRRPRVLCASCRSRKELAGGKAGAPANPALCFQCYRAGLERDRRIKAAGELDTASEVRFQTALPFEQVDTTRLALLKQQRVEARTAARSGTGAFVEKRRRAQIEARHALARVLQGLKERQMLRIDDARRESAPASRRGADLALPASWLPFVVSQ
jgi:hypothetical protein